MTGMVGLTNAPAADRAAMVLFEVAAHGGAQARAIGAAASGGALGELESVRPRALISLSGSGDVGHGADVFAAVAGADWDIPVVRSPRLPSWAGPLDVLLVVGADAGDPLLVEAVATASRRGVATVVSAPLEGPLRAAADSRVVDLAPRLAGGESFGFVQSLAAHIAVARAVRSSRGGSLVDVAALADLIDGEIFLAHPSRPIFENPARALAERMRGRRVVLAGDGPAAVAVARYGADVLLRVAGEPAQAADLATVLVAGERLASGGLSADAALFHDPELDGPLPAASRVFALSSARSKGDVAAQIRRLPDAEVLVAEESEAEQPTRRFPRQEEFADVPQLAVLAQRLALASVYVRLDEEH
ncbi:MAG: tobH protein [Segniliparus sp.]|uniref:tobH protein n=1 Tax=Segniliparus sp. TaxID=2804064 RepID=UPI003F2B83B7